MKKTILTALLAFGLGLGLTLIASTPSMAVHKGAGGLSCGGCHTMHSSQGNANMDGQTQNFRLIRGAGTTATSTTDLCLTCHSQNGTNAGTTFNTGVWATTPPKVHLTTAWSGGGFNTVGAGGDFANVGTFSGSGPWALSASDSGANVSLGRGHSLQATSVTPPGGAAVIATLSCVMCHNAHGTDVGTLNTNRYRNLAAYGTVNPWNISPTVPLAQSYVGAVAGSASGGTAIGAANNMWPVYNSTLNTSNYYLTNTTVAELTGIKVGMAYFCSLCHTNFHEPNVAGNNVSTTNSYDWVRHPAQNRLIDATPTSGSGITIVDMATYNSAATADKLPVAQDCGGPGSPACTAAEQKFYYDATTPNARVFCLSCHFAHAGPYYDALRWDHTASVSSGGQIGNVIASNVGCQLCHNR